MKSQLSALQFGKEFLEVKGKTEQEQLRRDVRLSAHEKSILVFQRFHVLDPPELRLVFLLFSGLVTDGLNKAVLLMLLQIQIIADTFISGICHNVTVTSVLHPLNVASLSVLDILLR